MSAVSLRHAIISGSSSLEEDSYLFHCVQLVFEVFYLAYKAHNTFWFSQNLSDELKFLKRFEQHSETFSVVSAVPRRGILYITIDIL